MLCDKCKKNTATYFSSVNINGNVTETHLCSECAKNEHTFNFNSFFGEPELSAFNYNLTEPTCDKCGYSLTDYINTGLLGCTNCYKAFSDYLNKNMLNFQYDKVHVGKQPNNYDNSEKSQIKLLELKLKQAVLEENYELASELKKEIIKLQGNQNENK